MTTHDVYMKAIEIIARNQCVEAGFHPDGTYGDDPMPHWHSFRGTAQDLIQELEHGGLRFQTAPEVCHT